MNRTMPRWRGILPLLIATPLVCACGKDPQTQSGGVQEAIEKGLNYLVSKQNEDGAWRSEVYGSLKDGPSLTPMVLKCLTFGSGLNAEVREKAAGYLRSMIPDGEAPFPRLELPVSTAALAVIALSRSPGEENQQAAAAWASHLRSWQLEEELGWNPEDIAYGGFGYSVTPPRKPPAGAEARLPFESDLCSTLFAVGALRLLGAPADDPAVRKALRFVQRCQNFPDERGGDPLFDDGGFTTTPHRDDQNKAGTAGVDRHGTTRFHSYGSATADGLRLLVRCGLGPEHPRVVAARAWLERNFSATSHPGVYTEVREPDREAVYFYYCWSVAHAFRLLGVTEIEQDGKRLPWIRPLTEELLRRQGGDGSYRNRYTFVKEDDPLIATALAIAALAASRLVPIPIDWPEQR